MNEGRTVVYVGLGSNLGDRGANLGRAVELIDELPATETIAASSVYETEPRLYSDQPDFLNSCAEVETALEPREFLEQLLGIEQAMGRVRRVDNGPRTVDLDILLFGHRVISQEGLEIPHPGLPERAFVLVPLVEIAADVVHPQLGQTMAQLLQACPDAGWIRPIQRSSGKKLAPTSHSTPK